VKRLSRYLLALSLAALPAGLFGFSTGSPARRTGAQVDGGGDCAGCHRTFAPANSNSAGRLQVIAADYLPGVRQRIRVTVSHPDSRRWGFQLAARQAANPIMQSGVFVPSMEVQVFCDDPGNVRNPAPCFGEREYATHRQPATTQGGASGSRTFDVDWVPPIDASGDVVLYAAGNAADGTGTNANDHIYTTSVTIRRAAGGAAPAISDAGVRSIFSGAQGVTPGGWVEIYGTNLARSTRTWDAGDFSNGRTQLDLDGVRVFIGGKQAAVGYVSPTQVNAQVAIDAMEGPVPMELIGPGGRSNPIAVNMARLRPAVFAGEQFRRGGVQYLSALIAGGGPPVWVGPEGLVPGLTTRPVLAGEVITFFGTGFGPTTPPVAAGTMAPGQNPAMVAGRVQVRFGETPATVQFAGLSPGFAGLFQFNVTVPTVGPGDVRISIEVDGVAVAQNVSLMVGR